MGDANQPKRPLNEVLRAQWREKGIPFSHVARKLEMSRQNLQVWLSRNKYGSKFLVDLARFAGLDEDLEQLEAQYEFGYIRQGSVIDKRRNKELLADHGFIRDLRFFDANVLEGILRSDNPHIVCIFVGTAHLYSWAIQWYWEFQGLLEAHEQHQMYILYPDEKRWIEDAYITDPLSREVPSMHQRLEEIARHAEDNQGSTARIHVHQISEVQFFHPWANTISISEITSSRGEVKNSYYLQVFQHKRGEAPMNWVEFPYVGFRHHNSIIEPIGLLHNIGIDVLPP